MALDPEMPVGVPQPDREHVELEFLAEELNDPVHHRLGIQGGGDPSGRLVEQAQLPHPSLEVLTTLLQGLRHLSEDVEDSLEAGGGPLRQGLQDGLGGRSPDGARQRTLGELEELAPVGLGQRTPVGDAPGVNEAAEGLLGLVAPDKLGHQLLEPLGGESVDTHGCRRPGPLALEHPHEAFGLGRLEQRGPRVEGDRGKGGDVEGDRPEDRVGPGAYPGDPEELLGAEPGDPEGPLADEALGDPARAHERGKEQRIDPDAEPGRESGQRALARGPAPVEATEEGGGELGHRRERDEADVHQRVRLADEVVVRVAEQDGDGDGQPLGVDEEPGDVAGHAAADERGNDQVVEDHRGQRD